MRERGGRRKGESIKRERRGGGGGEKRNEIIGQPINYIVQSYYFHLTTLYLYTCTRLLIIVHQSICSSRIEYHTEILKYVFTIVINFLFFSIFIIPFQIITNCQY